MGDKQTEMLKALAPRMSVLLQGKVHYIARTRAIHATHGISDALLALLHCSLMLMIVRSKLIHSPRRFYCLVKFIHGPIWPHPFVPLG